MAWEGTKRKREGTVWEVGEKEASERTARRERRLGAWWMLSLKMGDLEGRTERRGETGKKEKNNER